MGNAGHMATSRNSSKNAGISNLQPVSNIKLFPTHLESELGVLGVAIKLVKDEVHF
jgi:hypothetical protein